MSSQLVRDLRRQGAADGRSASVRIDRVEAMVARMATTVVRAFGADELRQRLGAEDALDLLAAAGEDTDRIRDRWDAERKAQEAAAPRQVSVVLDEGYGGDPAHDLRVTDAIMRGASNAELRQITSQVQAEYAERARQAAQKDSLNFMWTDSRGQRRYGDRVAALGVSADPRTGAPLQRSAVNQSVPELGSEPVGPVSMSDVRQVSGVQPCIEHPGQPGERHCTVCGRPRP